MNEKHTNQHWLQGGGRPGRLWKGGGMNEMHRESKIHIAELRTKRWEITRLIGKMDGGRSRQSCD